MKDKELRERVDKIEYDLNGYTHPYAKRFNSLGLIKEVGTLKAKLSHLERYLHITEVTTPAETKYVKGEGKR